LHFSPASYYFIPLRFTYSPRYPFFKHLSLRSSLNVNGQVSHPYKTTGKI
jgi:hypothetical protein